MNALALIVGNANYIQEKDRLNNAVNDAKDFAQMLLKLGFVVKEKTDCELVDFGKSLEEFSAELKSYDVGLFFYSGHGLQIEGKNYLTAINTSFADATTVKYDSICLDEIIEHMNKANPIVKILIIDACRDNPLPIAYRGGLSNGLAPVYAPKGTIIAFSTSPGEKAMDYGSGRNSIYTGALLNHIDDFNISIEDFFKRVRTTVYTLSNGKQTSWEHTSLIGNFCFNSGQLIHSVDLPYKNEYIADKDFTSDGTDIEEIIDGLRSHDWYKQNPAINKLGRINKRNISADDKFLLGRNLLQTAIGGEFSAQSIMRNLSNWLNDWSDEEENHVLNGLLFEIYFDSNGLFRRNNLKTGYINEIFDLEKHKQYKLSFEFIRNALLPFKDYVFYMPTYPPSTLPIELQFELEDMREFGGILMYKLLSVKMHDKEIMEPDQYEDACYTVTYNELKDKLSLEMAVPQKHLKLSSNIAEKDLSSKKIRIPWQMSLRLIDND